jgi:hypothetical protein
LGRGKRGCHRAGEPSPIRLEDEVQGRKDTQQEWKAYSRLQVKQASEVIREV